MKDFSNVVLELHYGDQEEIWLNRVQMRGHKIDHIK